MSADAEREVVHLDPVVAGQFELEARRLGADLGFAVLGILHLRPQLASANSWTADGFGTDWPSVPAKSTT